MRTAQNGQFQLILPGMVSQPHQAAPPPRPYQPPRLVFLGNLVDVVQSGGGKLSAPAPDGPDIRKPPGQ